ncbi:cell wall hydrolase [Gottfriedia acidiceleris]|uniref:cell wall hydrolase n=1 Tax=Gottfriedia acidiceleris TaxID=371036 RepID=UPI002F2660A4
MVRIKYNENDINLLARLIRAEAEAEGKRGMLAVGCVVINRALVRCSDFKNVNTVREVIYQYHDGDASFDAIQSPYFYQKATEPYIGLAKQCLEIWRDYPAKYSLWYFNPPGVESQPCPNSWYNQPFAGKWKNHCFYEPTGQECAEIYVQVK